jgi:DNA repair protein RecN (Recombination protein N)
LIHELFLENFVLIDRAELVFPPGLIAITGETGAGKSLFIHGIKLVLGGKFLNQHIKNNEESSQIQAIIGIDSNKKWILDELGILPENDELIIRRAVTKNNRNKNIISGSQVSISELKKITEDIVSIAGQHEQQNLLKEEMHLIWLDLYAGIEEKKNSYFQKFRDWQGLSTELDAKLKKKRDINSLIEKLETNSQKIDAISPKKNEDTVLEENIRLLKSSAQLVNLGNECHKNLYSQKGSVIENLYKIKLDMEKMTLIDSTLEKTFKDIENAHFLLEEISDVLRDYLERLPRDVSRLEQMEDRFYALRELKRHFGPELDDVILYRRQIDAEIEELKKNDLFINEISDKIEKKEKELIEEAIIISNIRINASKKFSFEIEDSISQLKMKGTRFEIQVLAPENPDKNSLTSTGIDKVAFLFSANPGAPLRPLKEIASGGELSRVMLSIREILSENQDAGTIIFDEIDAGLSAEVAELVGQKLKKLSKSMQVFVITHFPQIAALADSHFIVKKNILLNHTTTDIFEIKGEDRKREIARMLGGINDASLKLSERLLRQER